MASQDFPLITDPHAPTRLPPNPDSSTPNPDFYPNPSFTASTNEDSDPDKSGSVSGSKRNPYYYKKQKTGTNSNTTITTTNNNHETTSEYRVDYRKDREEWSDTAISCLLDAYTEKLSQLNRGNLRGRDWEEVAEAVAERCGGGSGGGGGEKQQKAWKSVEQCKNKIDNLKKRYKVEVQRVSGGNSNWHWFKQIEAIIGNIANNNSLNKTSSASAAAAAESDQDMNAVAAAAVSLIVSPSSRNLKRYTPSSVAMTNNLKSKPQQNLKWRRVMFKISGSALAGNSQNIDSKVVMQIAREVTKACRLGVEVAIVLGGRNFFCGDSWVSATGFDRSTAYQVGMMATVMNSVLLQSALEKLGVQARVQSAFALPEVAEPYNRQRAIRHLEKGRVVIFGGVGAGTGNPLYTTDSAAALRASEINAEAVLKGTTLNDIYDCHSGNGSIAPEHISFREVVSGNCTSMDTAAITYCEQNGIPVVVFNLLEPENISRALCGEQVGTLIDQTGRMG
ncbi:hypothetical protein LWI29_009145 [Acer saccharum]|uniref:UMP kinase n=1 Tax=Acer saccharum TaxID=4024 RepID=A0AA39SIW8_ACESA|nr:hypothetical protein LWI29_009145 [Acer saccharum]